MKEVLKKYADLHIHSRFSDSSLTPQEVLKFAQMVGLSCVSITDHDTVDGVPEAFEYAKKLDIEFIPGIELSAVYKGLEVHILGYFIDWQDSEFLEILNKIRVFRKDRIKRILQILNKHKMEITFDQVVSFSGGHSLGRPHVAKAMVEGGYVEKLQDAFNYYLGENQVAFVPKYHLTPKDAVDLIKRANGIPILAHPVFLYKRINIFDLINMGIRGLEVTHTQHSYNDEKYFKKICNDHHLLKTGGSDFHGVLNETMLIGGKKIPYEYIKDLKRENQVILNLQD